MQKFLVKWMVEGEMVVEATDLESAERTVQQNLVATITDAEKWPAEFGATGIQGAASLVEDQA
jgi:hypothetical protein